MIPIPTFVRGQARAVVGTLRFADGSAAALRGTTITNTQGTTMGLSLTGTHVSVTSPNGFSSSPGAGPIFNIAFSAADRRLKVGDSGSGDIDNSGAFFTVIDCATVPDVP